MNTIESYFLQALKASLQNKTIKWETILSPEEWTGLFQMADKHHVFPMIYEAVYACLAEQCPDPQLIMTAKRKTIQSVMMQTMTTSDFLQLYVHLQKKGISPMVVKGIICRSLYPKPDYRMSGDEDVQIPAEQYEACHEALLEYGMQNTEDGKDIMAAYEVPYRKKNGPLYIELHKDLFPPESDAYGDWNHFFADAREHAVTIDIDGVGIMTMGYDDHLFYLICHAFKHFLHSGFGIRQVCDIVMFANAYGSRIDWHRLMERCKVIHAEMFAAALFKIGEKYLVFDREKAAWSTEWSELEVDEGLMLDDLLDAGVFGSSSMSRKHSSTITLSEMAAQKSGRKGGKGVVKSLFPPAKDLEHKYEYLKKHPYLLPAAWTERILKYRKETKMAQDNNAMSSIQIGTQRIEMMKQYGILRDSHRRDEQ